MIVTVLIASALVYSWKFLGYLLPKHLHTEGLQLLADRVTVALLAGLVGVQGFVVGGSVVLDARFPALILAAILLWLRTPFILVVISAAACAALIRAFF